MKNIIFTFILILICFSCTNNENKILLYNQYYYALKEGETVESTNSSLEKYKNNFSFENIQIPLFRKIKNQNYERFIGIPYQANLSKVKNEVGKRKNIFFVSQHTDTTSYYVYKNKEFFYSEFTFSPDSSLIVYIATIYQDSTSISSANSLLETIQKP